MIPKAFIAVTLSAAVLFSFSSCSSTPGSGASAGRFDTIVAYGDSITRGYAVKPGEGFIELLAAENLSGRRIVNAGGNGDTTREALRRFDTDVAPHLPALVIVEFGGNDSGEGPRHVPLDEFERNLREIRRRVLDGGGAIVLMTFPPVTNDRHVHGQHAYYIERGGLDLWVEEYRAKTRELARRWGVPLFDLDALLRPRHVRNPAIVHADGVHLTPAANRIVAEFLQEFLLKHSR